MTPQVQFFEKYAAAAETTQMKYGVPASITLAQAALESAYGRSAPGNNFFGIKADASWHGPSSQQDTTEVVNNVSIPIKSGFRVYDNAGESFNDHGLFLTQNSRYKTLFSLPVEDYRSWATGLQKAGYATDPAYAMKLISIIEGFGLNTYTQNAKKKSG